MFVVVEIEDWADNEGLVHELRMLQASHEEIINDELFDPDDLGDETLTIKTDTVSLNVARIVGIARRLGPQGLTHEITPLDKA